MKETIEILLDRIVDLEKKLERKDRELRQVIDYLLEKGIVLTHWTSRLTSDLDKEEEE